MAHSEFSPSQLSRIIACPASVQLCREVPRLGSSSYAEEGTLLHSYMQEIIEGVLTIDEIAEVEHREACFDALMYVQSIERDDSALLYTETKVAIEAEPEVYGTADVIIVDDFNCVLHVVDFKFGRNVLVNSHENKQLMAYAKGAMDTFNKRDVSWVRMHIVQPFMNNYQHFDMGRTDLCHWASTELHNAIVQANGENPAYNPSEDACRWCSGRAVCPAAKEYAQAIAGKAFELVKTRSLSPEAIADFYTSIPMYDGYVKAVRDYVTNSLKCGVTIPGFKLVRTRQTRSFISEADVMRFFEKREEYAMDEIFSTELLSPAQLEKRFGSKLKNDEGFKALIQKSDGNLTVVPESDSRAPVSAENPFSEVVEK